MSIPGEGSRSHAARAQVDLRALGPDDVHLVSALEAQIFSEDPWTRAMVAEELSAPGRHYVGAEVEEHLVGYAGILIGPDSDVMTIGVLPDHRGGGVGTLLLEDIVAAARTIGSERVFLEVRASNESAQRLYLAHGFRRIGMVRHYFRNPREDAVTMRLDLGDTHGAPIGAAD
ncbi:MAG: ribosomal protein S18-alanine N-acetyltransferase [Pauljensenia sp.]